MNKRTNKTYDYKGKKEKWPIRPTDHPKNLVPKIKYDNKKLYNNTIIVALCTAIGVR